MRTRALAVLTVVLTGVLTVVLTGVLVTIGATAGASAAREVVLHDPAGDVWRMGFSGDTQEQAPRTRAGDVRRTVFRHRRANVVIRQRYADLRRIGDYTLYTVRIQNGSRTRYREVQVEAGPRSWRGTVRVFNRRGSRVECDATHRIDYLQNTLVVTVPRTCLGTPAAVRVTASGFWADRSQGSFLVDNPHNERPGAGSWTRWLRSS